MDFERIFRHTHVYFELRVPGHCLAKHDGRNKSIACIFFLSRNICKGCVVEALTLVLETAFPEFHISVGRRCVIRIVSESQITHARDESFFQSPLDGLCLWPQVMRSTRSRRSKTWSQRTHFGTVFISQPGGVTSIHFQINRVKEYPGRPLLRQGVHKKQTIMLRI